MRRLRRDSLTPGLRGAIVAGIVLHIAGIALIGATWRLPAPPVPPGPFVRLSDAVMNERAEMLDPSPLFLPTSLNHGAELAKPGTVMAAGPVAPLSGDPDEPPLDPPRSNKPDPSVAPLPPDPVYGPLTPSYAARPVADKLSLRTADLFLTAGRREPDVSHLGAEGPRYVVTDEVSGKVVASGPLAVPASSSGTKPFPLRPAAFFVEVNGYGISAPMLRPRTGGLPAGTGDSATDARLAAALAVGLAKAPPPTGRWTVVATP